ncbi:MAG TPA: mycothiol synthase [Nocardioidaceae bacterium]|nr:mycothiol synthase [Nocardioidaceae bacterium]
MIFIARTAPHLYDAPENVSVAEHKVKTSTAIRSVVAAATREDGRSPLNEATLLALQHHGLEGKALWVARDDSGEIVGFALADTDPDVVDAQGRSEDVGPVEVNLVVAPAARGSGVGRALAQEVLESLADVPVTAWSHGNHPAAARLATALGFERVRDLWVMRRPLSPDHPLPPVPREGGIVVRPFRPGQDEEAFLALNAEAFAGHPEQGSMTRADLDQRMAEPWFDPAGFFLAEDARAPQGEPDQGVESPSLLGFHWTKVHLDEEPPVGEVYVVGVSPAAQGRGLGKILTLTGLHHLQDRGPAEVILYVEADNAPAIAVYAGLGFTHAAEDTDVMYARRRDEKG